MKQFVLGVITGGAVMAGILTIESQPRPKSVIQPVERESRSVDVAPSVATSVGIASSVGTATLTGASAVEEPLQVWEVLRKEFAGGKWKATSTIFVYKFARGRDQKCYALVQIPVTDSGTLLGEVPCE
jgi:hypothetical protein